MNKYVCLLTLIFLSTSATAKVFGLQVMGMWQVNNIFRGAQTWPKATAFAAPGIVLFDRFFIRGPNLTYSFFPDRKSPIEFEISGNYINDDEPPFNFFDHQRDYRNQRKDAVELSTRFRYKFGFRNKFYLGALFAKEVIRHKGLYSELQAGAPLLPFTSLNLAYSIAEKSSNQYIYGPEGVSGGGFARAGVSLVIPFVPWDGIAMASYNHFWVLQDSNKNADYIRGNDEQNNVTVRLIWNAI